MNIGIREAGLIDRLKLPTPDWWKKFGTNCFVLGTIIGIIGGSLAPVLNETVVIVIVTIGGTFALVGKFLATLTVDWDRARMKEINKEDNTMN